MTYGLKVADAEGNRQVVERLNRIISNVEAEDRYHARNPHVPRTPIRPDCRRGNPCGCPLPAQGDANRGTT